jgi:adenosylcobinamide hydrolase
MLDFPGMSMTRTDDACILSSNTALCTLSSAVVGGGFLQTRTIINRHVPHNYNGSDPASDLQRFAAAVGCEELFVGMMTGVPMTHMQSATARHGDATVASVITAGLGNVVASGLSKPTHCLPGTINIVVLIDANLVVEAMVNAVITATEAKTGVLVELGTRTEEGYPATGTSTDAMVIACTGRGAPVPYAGPGTWIGYLIGLCVRQGLVKALGEPACSPSAGRELVPKYSS